MNRFLVLMMAVGSEKKEPAVELPLPVETEVADEKEEEESRNCWLGS